MDLDFLSLRRIILQKGALLRADVARRRLPRVGGETPSHEVLALLAKAGAEGIQIKPNRPGSNTQHSEHTEC